MFVGAATSLVVGEAQVVSADRNDAASAAADAGLRYAQARLSEDYLWRGDGSGLVVDMPDLAVREDRGNVIGVLRAPGGEFAQFRIRFNYQDGGGEHGDGLLDPTTLVMDQPFVSINNLIGGAAVPVPRASGAGGRVLAEDIDSAAYEVPPGTACLLVEGRAGPGLRELNTTNLNPTVTGGRVNSRVVEAYFRATNPPGADAAVMAADDADFDLGNGNGLVTVTNHSDQGNPRVRSKAAIRVSGGNLSENYVSPDGETRSQSGGLQANYNSAQGHCPQ